MTLSLKRLIDILQYFNAPLMTHFRKRLSSDVIKRFNEKVLELARRETPQENALLPDGGSKPDSPERPSEPRNAVTILMDAACASADIKYPTDLNIVNDTRRLTEVIIDQLRKQLNNPSPRLRIRSQICRRRCIKIIVHPKCGLAKRRKESSETVIAIAILTANLIRWEQDMARLLFFSSPVIITWNINIDKNDEDYHVAA